MQWNELKVLGQSAHRQCLQCNRTILKTEGLSDEELIGLVEQDPHACLQLQFDQENLVMNPFAQIK